MPSTNLPMRMHVPMQACARAHAAHAESESGAVPLQQPPQSYLGPARGEGPPNKLTVRHVHALRMKDVAAMV